MKAGEVVVVTLLRMETAARGALIPARVGGDIAPLPDAAGNGKAAEEVLVCDTPSRDEAGGEPTDDIKCSDGEKGDLST